MEKIKKAGLRRKIERSGGRWSWHDLYEHKPCIGGIEKGKQII